MAGEKNNLTQFEPGLPYKLAGQLFGGRKYYCSMCAEEIKGFKDRLSAREFRVTGMCQKCQDKVFDERKSTVPTGQPKQGA